MALLATLLTEVADAMSYYQKRHQGHSGSRHMCNFVLLAPDINLRCTPIARTSLVPTCGTSARLSPEQGLPLHASRSDKRLRTAGAQTSPCRMCVTRTSGSASPPHPAAPGIPHSHLPSSDCRTHRAQARLCPAPQPSAAMWPTPTHLVPGRSSKFFATITLRCLRELPSRGYIYRNRSHS